MPPSFVSHIPNLAVYDQAGRRPIRFRLLYYQLMLFGHVARLPNADAVRLSLLRRDDVQPASFNFKQRGGQRNCWIDQVYVHALKVAGDLVGLRNLVMNKAMWKVAARRYIDGAE